MSQPNSNREEQETARLEKLIQTCREQHVDFSTPYEYIPKGAIIQDKGVLITGGASGIGEAMARAFAAAGAYVTILDLNQPRGEQLMAEMTEKGHKMIFHAADITNYDEQLAAFKVAQSFSPSGHLHHVFANAGNIGSFTTYPSEAAENFNSLGGEVGKNPAKPSLPCVQVSLIGMYYTAYLALHFLTLGGTKAKSGALDAAAAEKDTLDRSLTLMGSVLSYKGNRGIVDYCMAKAGVRGMFKSLRNDIKESTGIRLNLIAPTYVDTPFYPEGVDLSDYKFAPMRFIVQIAQQLVCDTTIYGRSIIITADGPKDMDDDIAGLDGAPVIKDFLLGHNMVNVGP